MNRPVEGLGSFEQLVLAAVLALGDDAYGPTVSEKVIELGRKPVRLGAIYVTLDRMEQKGLLITVYEPNTRKGRPAQTLLSPPAFR